MQAHRTDIGSSWRRSDRVDLEAVVDETYKELVEIQKYMLEQEEREQAEAVEATGDRAREGGVVGGTAEKEGEASKRGGHIDTDNHLIDRAEFADFLRTPIRSPPNREFFAVCFISSCDINLPGTTS